MRRLRAIAVAVVLLACLTPAAAQAGPSAYDRVLRAYQRFGGIPTCRFSSEVLAAALREENTYGQEYFADFTEAIQSALSERAAGQCRPGATPAGATAGAPGGPAPPSGPVGGATSAGVPAPIVLLAAIAAVLAAIAAAVALAGARGWDPAWAATVRHAWGETGYHASLTWAEFRDWFRSAR